MARLSADPDVIYLDNNATTRLAPEVFDAMHPFLDASYGNASSAHSSGREAARAIDLARMAVGRMIGASDLHEIVFTSSGTESDNWAIRGALAAAGKQHIITTTVEHDAVRRTCEALERGGAQVTWLEVDRDGHLDLEALRDSLSPDTAVVSVMMANNETGVLFPIDEIGSIVRGSSNAIFHVDAVNAAGKVPIDVSSGLIDLLSLSGHKFYGPKGCGVLYIRNGIELAPALLGGSQEGGRRASTEAGHQIAGLGAAAKLAADLSSADRIAAMRDRLEGEILRRIPNATRNGTGDPAHRLPNTSSISFENTNGEMILAALDEAGIAVSTGSACNSNVKRGSHVLEAMNIPYSQAMGSIRFSLGRFNTPDEIEHVIEILPGLIAYVRERSGTA